MRIQEKKTFFSDPCAESSPPREPPSIISDLRFFPHSLRTVLCTPALGRAGVQERLSLLLPSHFLSEPLPQVPEELPGRARCVSSLPSLIALPTRPHDREEPPSSCSFPLPTGPSAPDVRNQVLSKHQRISALSHFLGAPAGQAREAYSVDTSKRRLRTFVLQPA